MYQKQREATRHIQTLLSNRGLNIPSRKLTLPDNQQWIVFDQAGRQIGVDTVSGVWVRASQSDDWRCLALPCTVSGALQAVEFLTKE
jgi:hypothetical protein